MMKINKEKEIYAIAVVIEREDGRVLYGKRNEEYVEEYKGYWSLPSMPIEKAEYYIALKSGKLSDAVAERFAEKRLANIHIKGGKLIINGSRQRTNYLLNMAVFKATTDDELPKKTPKYEELKFLSPTQFLEVSGRICGTCTSLYLQSLVNQGILPSTIEYLEVPPEIAESDRKLEDYSPEELWDLACLNYPLLIRGETGGDGHFIRSLTLERFLEDFIEKEIRAGIRILDIGCGEGSFFEKIGNKTEFAYGLDLEENMLEKPELSSGKVRIGTLYDAPKIFADIRFDWIAMNLVLSWISNLDAAVKAVRLLLDEKGKVLVTLTPPEFTKNGQWLKVNDEFNWLITKPLRREKELTMINRLVGPLWFYPKSTIDYLNIFGNNGL